MMNFESLIRGLTTNVAQLDPNASDPGLRPQQLDSSPTESADRIDAWVKSQSGWAVESRRDEGELISLHLTRTTRVFRFVDDIHVELKLNNDGTLMSAKSQSRIGKGDLGQNPRNLKALTSGIQEE